MAHLQNRLLAALPADVFNTLHPYLKTAELASGQVLSEPGDEIRQVYFPQQGIISLVVELKSGDVIETAMIGSDGVVNATAASDGAIALGKSMVQLAGTSSVMAVGPYRESFLQFKQFRHLVMLHEQVLFAHAQQSVACNARHSIEARACRWLLRMRDLADSDEIALTHEELALMLGVRRSGVSTVAEALQRTSLISYHRGLIRLADIDGLRRTACECYSVVKTLYQNLVKLKC